MGRRRYSYCIMVLLLAPASYGVGGLAAAAELRDPMQPPAFALRKYRLAKPGNKPSPAKADTAKVAARPLQLTSILLAPNRRIAIIDDQMLAVGDRIRGHKLVKITRTSARLLRQGKLVTLDLDNGFDAIKKPALEGDR